MSYPNARLACSFLISRLTGEIERLKEQVFPGHDPGPRLWLAFIGGLVQTAEGYVNTSRTAPASTQSDLIRSAETLSDTAYRLLMHASGVDATQIPHQVVAPFQRWVSRLQITNTIFFRAEHAPNYELSWFDCRQFVNNINNPSKELVDQTSRINWPVLRVTVPGQSMGMLPHFAVVAHELGHAIQDRIIVDLTMHDLAFQACIKAIEQRILSSGMPFDTSAKISLQKTVSSWINEMKADAVGLYLAGPAFFFALCGFLELSGQSYGVSSSHPPSDLRRDLLVEELKSGGSASFYNVLLSTGISVVDDINSPHIARCPSKDHLFNQLANRIPVVDACICVELIDLFRQMSPDIYSATKSLVEIVDKELVYNPEMLSKDIERHLAALSFLIPPIEFREDGLDKPASLATILNIGWIALLSSLDSIPVSPNSIGDIDALRMERLHELLLKAVELSEARTLWDEQI